MATMSMRELEENLDRALTRVEDGEEITISRHGRVVAKLVPAGDGRKPAEDPDDVWSRLSSEARAANDRLRDG